MQIETDVRTVRDEDALTGGRQTLGFELGQFLEKARDVEDSAGADEVETGGRNQTGGENVEVVRYVLVNDSVSGV